MTIESYDVCSARVALSRFMAIDQGGFEDEGGI